LKKRRTPWKFVGFTDANIRGPNRLPVNGPGGAAVGIGQLQPAPALVRPAFACPTSDLLSRPLCAPLRLKENILHGRRGLGPMPARHFLHGLSTTRASADARIFAPVNLNVLLTLFSSHGATPPGLKHFARSPPHRPPEHTTRVKAVSNADRAKQSRFQGNHRVVGDGAGFPDQVTHTPLYASSPLAHCRDPLIHDFLRCLRRCVWIHRWKPI
jgi:hypothetical protein